MLEQPRGDFVAAGNEYGASGHVCVVTQKAISAPVAVAVAVAAAAAAAVVVVCVGGWGGRVDR